jgi:hypothetical protein
MSILTLIALTAFTFFAALSITMALAMLVSKDLRDHIIAFFSPFLIDSVFSCKTSEAVADELLDANLLKNVEGKLAIVTGCTLGGIGAQTVSQFIRDLLSWNNPSYVAQAAILAGRAGMEVVCAGRSMKKLEDCVTSLKKSYPNAKLTPLLLDVSSFASVREFVRSFESKFPVGGKDLVLLVNNAGIMASPYSTSVDGIELQMATNHLGPFLLSCLLTPRLKLGAKASPAFGARVVNVASMAHALPFPFGSNTPLPLNKPYSDKAGPKFFAYGGCCLLFEISSALLQLCLHSRASLFQGGQSVRTFFPPCLLLSV